MVSRTCRQPKHASEQQKGNSVFLNVSRILFSLRNNCTPRRAPFWNYATWVLKGFGGRCASRTQSSLRCYGSGLGMPAGSLVPNWMTLIRLPKGVGQLFWTLVSWTTTVKWNRVSLHSLVNLSAIILINLFLRFCSRTIFDSEYWFKALTPTASGNHWFYQCWGWDIFFARTVLERWAPTIFDWDHWSRRQARHSRRWAANCQLHHVSNLYVPKLIRSART